MTAGREFLASEPMRQYEEKKAEAEKAKADAAMKDAAAKKDEAAKAGEARRAAGCGDARRRRRPQRPDGMMAGVMPGRRAMKDEKDKKLR